jgi:predicted  nucleic acid-binding Zn-ribbon protein
MNRSTSPAPAAIDREKFEIRLGEALNKAGLLTPAQLAQAMWEKADNPLMLGELCMQHGWVAPEDLYPLIPIELVRIGEILMLHGYLELEQIHEALIYQKQQPQRKLGEILVQQGWVQSHWLDWALDKQQQLRRQAGAANSWEVMLEQWSTIPDQPSLYPSPLQAARGAYKVTQQYKAQLESYKEQIATLQAQLEQQREQQRAMAGQSVQQIADYQARQHEQQQRIAELETQLANQIEQGSEQQTAAQQRIQELEGQLQAQQTQGSAQTQSLAEQLQSAQTELETLRRRCHELTEWQSQAKHKLQELASQLQQQQQLQRGQAQQAQDQAHLRHTLQQTEAQVAALNQSLQEHQHQLQLAQSTKNRLVSDLAQARKETAEATHRLQVQYQEVQAQLQKAQAQVRQLQAQLQKTQEENRALTLAAAQAKPSPPAPAAPTPVQEEAQPEEEDIEALTIAELAAGMSTPVAEPMELPPQVYLGEEDLQALQRATPWVQRVLTQLRAAGLIDNASIETVIHAWEKEGGTFTDVLAHHSGLKPETVKFFSEGGYSVQLAGGRHVADYLKASGLVSATQIEQIQKHLPPGGSLCHALAQAGILHRTTALYFERNFGGQKPRRSLREELS